MSVITPALTAHLREHFALDWHDIHGAAHWARVRANGLRLAAATGARTRVVELFAFLHDARRQDDDRDPGHGGRAADLARELHGRFFRLADGELALLAQACRHHSEGHTAGADVTVLTCWDADRLDLGRVQEYPDSRRLCTAAARDPAMIKWAHERSRRWLERHWRRCDVRR